MSFTVRCPKCKRYYEKQTVSTACPKCYEDKLLARAGDSPSSPLPVEPDSLVGSSPASDA